MLFDVKVYSEISVSCRYGLNTNKMDLGIDFDVEVFSELSVNYGYGLNLINNKNNNNR